MKDFNDSENPQSIIDKPRRDAFSLLKLEIKTMPNQKPSHVYMWSVFISYCVIALLPLFITFVADHLLAKLFCIFISAWGFLGISTQCHTASHNALSSIEGVNRGITFFGYAFVLGLSANYWRHHHIGAHHREPNMVGVDADIELGPLFAVTEDIVNNSGVILRAYYSLQWLFLPIAISLNAFNIQLRGMRFLIGQCLKKTKSTSNKNLVIDFCLLFLHYSVWLIIPSFLFPFTGVLLTYLCIFFMIGYCLFFTFAPCHFPQEALCLNTSSAPTNNFLLRQSATTTNYSTGKIGQYFCGGLGYQIEHHLFPSVHHRHLANLSNVVKPFCQKYHYPYRSWSWGRAILKSLHTFYRPKPIQAWLAVPED